MKTRSTIFTISFCLLLNITTQAQLGISHLNHKHTTLLSFDYEPFEDYVLFLMRFGKVIGSNTLVGVNVGYSESPFNGRISMNTVLPENLYTAGLESEYFLTRFLDIYPVSISTFGRYQFELYDLNQGYDIRHHFDLKLRALYPFRYKKVSISPYISFGGSNFFNTNWSFNHDIGGIIGLHFSESDYCYLSIYSQRYEGGFDADNRSFVSLGLLW